MLTHLSLKDFVIVKELSLDLSSGLTVLTGETGAGKSILIDALQMVLGARADTGVIREGAKQTDITAIFDVNNDVLELLRDAALTDNDDLLEKTAIIRRVIDANGRSRSWINGIAVTASQVKEVAAKLLDIHGQNAQQSLLKPAGQLALLDAYGGYRSDLLAVKSAYGRWQEASLHLQKAKDDAKKLADEMKKQNKNIPCFVQVNTGEEPQKGGIVPRETISLVNQCRDLGLNIIGLMCIPPVEDEPSPHFALLKKLARQANVPELSMGMSDDFPVAIQQGATFVRVGTALFGSRSQQK